MAGYLHLAHMPLSDNWIILLLLTKMWGSINRMALLRSRAEEHKSGTQKWLRRRRGWGAACSLLHGLGSKSWHHQLSGGCALIQPFPFKSSFLGTSSCRRNDDFFENLTLIFLIALLMWNSHTIKFTHPVGTVWVLGNVSSCPTMTRAYSFLAWSHDPPMVAPASVLLPSLAPGKHRNWL